MERPDLDSDVLEQLKKNEETFRDTMERLFQRYSNLPDLGPELCLKTMTFISRKGSVPLGSATARKELQDLKNRLIERPLEGLDRSLEEHTVLDQDAHPSLGLMDETVDDLDPPSQMDNSNNSLRCDAKTSQVSLNSMSISGSCVWDEAPQPEEDDHELEQTLSSHGNTLLDVYPSMLQKIGESYRRQHVTNRASAVLHGYRRRLLQSFKKQQHNHGYINSSHTTKESSIAVPKPPRQVITSHKEIKVNCQGSSSRKKSKQDFLTMKIADNTLSGSTACFYSPRREDLEKASEVKPGCRWTGQHSNRGSPHKPVRVIDLSTPLSSSPRSPSPDLNQTYVIEPVPLPRSQGVPASSVSGSTWSPLKMSIMLSHASQGGSSIHRSPSLNRSGLHKDHHHYCTASPQTVSSSHVSMLRSPLKARIVSLDHDQQTSLSNPRPVIRTSPYNDPRSFSPRHREHSTKQLKHQPSFSRSYSPSTSIPKMPSNQLDAEFMSLYHYFICRSTDPTSSCYLCKRQSGLQSPAMSSKSMSALSLTPVRSQKRRHDPEVVESLRFKRFRESCSPPRTTQFWPKHPQQQEAKRRVKTPVVEPSDDKYTWNRSLLLQCPSPGFLNTIRQHKRLASGSGRKGPGSILDRHTQCYSPSWRDSVRYRGDGENFENRSPLRTWNESGESGSPRMSRRRLMYGPVQ